MDYNVLDLIVIAGSLAMVD